MPTACENTRVIKKIGASQPGALKLARRYGNALVCVRYRCDKQGLIRYTTVELLVDETPIQRRGTGHEEVTIRLRRKNTHELRTRLDTLGAKWDRTTHVWRLPRSTARKLGLLDCIVKT